MRRRTRAKAEAVKLVLVAVASTGAAWMAAEPIRVPAVAGAAFAARAPETVAAQVLLPRSAREVISCDAALGVETQPGAQQGRGGKA